MAKPSEEGIELSADDEDALDRAWARYAEANPGYRASSDEVERLRRLPQHRAKLYARMPPYEEQQRQMTALRSARDEGGVKVAETSDSDTDRAEHGIMSYSELATEIDAWVDLWLRVPFSPCE